jgi:hypothetical protein
MPENATVDVEPKDKRTNEWKAWKARQSPAADSDVMADSALPLSWAEFTEQYPWPEFAKKTLMNGLNDRAAMMVASYGERQSGLTGKVQQLYRVFYYCLLDGPKPPSEVNE